MTKKFFTLLLLASAALMARTDLQLARTEFVCPGDFHFTVENDSNSADRITITDRSNNKHELKRRSTQVRRWYADANGHVIFGQQGQEAFFTIGDVLHIESLAFMFSSRRLGWTSAGNRPSVIATTFLTRFSVPLIPNTQLQLRLWPSELAVDCHAVRGKPVSFLRGVQAA